MEQKNPYNNIKAMSVKSDFRNNEWMNECLMTPQHEYYK